MDLINSYEFSFVSLVSIQVLFAADVEKHFISRSVAASGAAEAAAHEESIMARRQGRDTLPAGPAFQVFLAGSMV